MKFELEPHHRNISNEDLIADLRRVAEEQGMSRLTGRFYGKHGQFSEETIRRRFGSWNEALKHADLDPAKRHLIPDEMLFENLEKIWRELGRQPHREDLSRVPTLVSKSVYDYRFGSWRKALEAFVAWINSDSEAEIFPSSISPSLRKNTPRQPSLRLRFHVMSRDEFRCRQCGRSPALESGVQLHIDHVIPWSAGGETCIENLKTLCEKCNLGKSNLPGKVSD